MEKLKESLAAALKALETAKKNEKNPEYDMFWDRLMAMENHIIARLDYFIENSAYGKKKSGK